jgi:class 3 adenylate cyclase
MARLDSAERAKLPDTAFAYIDARGQRRLPIYDEPHVRNALARFNQVTFEDERARERARTRLLKAAKRYGIVPVGFISGQLRSERELGRTRAVEAVSLPSGFVTMLMTDIEGSTALVQQLDVRYRDLLNAVRAILRTTAAAAGGQVVEARADEFFAVFETPQAALVTAMAIQQALKDASFVDGLRVRMRIGIHSGYPTQTDANYIGLPVHITSRICGVAHGGQIVVSGDTRLAIKGARPDGVRFRDLGQHRLRGIPAPVPLFQLAAKGLAGRFPPPRT